MTTIFARRPAAAVSATVALFAIALGLLFIDRSLAAVQSALNRSDAFLEAVPPGIGRTNSNLRGIDTALFDVRKHEASALDSLRAIDEELKSIDATLSSTTAGLQSVDSATAELERAMREIAALVPGVRRGR